MASASIKSIYAVVFVDEICFHVWSEGWFGKKVVYALSLRMLKIVVVIVKDV